jgi:hypothetical protein
MIAVSSDFVIAAMELREAARGLLNSQDPSVNTYPIEHWIEKLTEALKNSDRAVMGQLRKSTC